MVESALQVESLQQAAAANSLDKFQLVFRRMLQSLLIDRLDINEGIVGRYMNETEFQEVVARFLGERVYQRMSKPVVTAGAEV